MGVVLPKRPAKGKGPKKKRMSKIQLKIALGYGQTKAGNFLFPVLTFAYGPGFFALWLMGFMFKFTRVNV